MVDIDYLEFTFVRTNNSTMHQICSEILFDVVAYEKPESEMEGMIDMIMESLDLDAQRDKEPQKNSLYPDILRD